MKTFMKWWPLWLGLAVLFQFAPVFIKLAHGEGALASTEDHWGVVIRKEKYQVEGMPVYIDSVIMNCLWDRKFVCEDMAEALNQAHLRRISANGALLQYPPVNHGVIEPINVIPSDPPKGADWDKP